MKARCPWCKRLGFKGHQAAERKLMQAVSRWAIDGNIRNWRRAEKAVEAYCKGKKGAKG